MINHDIFEWFEDWRDLKIEERSIITAPTKRATNNQTKRAKYILEIISKHSKT